MDLLSRQVAAADTMAELEIKAGQLRERLRTSESDEAIYLHRQHRARPIYSDREKKYAHSHSLGLGWIYSRRRRDTRGGRVSRVGPDASSSGTLSRNPSDNHVLTDRVSGKREAASLNDRIAVAGHTERHNAREPRVELVPPSATPTTSPPCEHQARHARQRQEDAIRSSGPRGRDTRGSPAKCSLPSEFS